jgi:hypothetical protein
LWDDFIIFQAKARKARLEAKNAHALKRLTKGYTTQVLQLDVSWFVSGYTPALLIISAVVK